MNQPEIEALSNTSTGGKDWLASAVGAMLQARERIGAAGRDQRGLSQSTENAVLITGGVALALVVIGVVRAFVQNKLGELG